MAKAIPLRRDVPDKMLTPGLLGLDSAVGLADGDCTMGAVADSVADWAGTGGGANIPIASEDIMTVSAKSGVRAPVRPGARGADGGGAGGANAPGGGPMRPGARGTDGGGGGGANAPVCRAAAPT
jgi:hypothetical protein